MSKKEDIDNLRRAVLDGSAKNHYIEAADIGARYVQDVFDLICKKIKEGDAFLYIDREFGYYDHFKFQPDKVQFIKKFLPKIKKKLSDAGLTFSLWVYLDGEDEDLFISQEDKNKNPKFKLKGLYIDSYNLNKFFFEKEIGKLKNLA